MNICGEFQQGGLQLGSDGSETGQANRIRTDFIPVIASSSYIISNYNDIINNLGIGFYDANKAFISSISSGAWLNFPYTITIPSNAKYVRISFRNTDNRNITPDLDYKIKLEPGSKATPYSPYGMGSINEYIRPKQLFNVKTVGNGFLIVNTGGVAPNTDWKVSDYIKIYKLIKITFSWVSNNNFFQVNMCYYDKNKNFISGVSQQGADKYKHTFTVPENAYYCRVGYSVKVGETIATRDKIQLEEGTANTDYEEYKEPQTYSIYTQQPFRSIGDVRDCFVKKSDDWYERHLPYIASYNGETLPQDVYNEVEGIKYCNNKSMSTTGQFSTGASVQYLDESNWNCLPCTQSQIDILENIPSTFSGQTNVFSEDEVKAYLRAKGLKDLNTLVNN